MDVHRTILTTVALGLALIGLTARPESAQLMPKAQVANLIANVENGVDDFRDYLEKRGENAKDTPSTAQHRARRRGRTRPIHRSPKRAPRRTRSTMRWAT
jgi:hypothetical protein